MVWDCPRALDAGVVWEARADGSIALRASGGLVLAAAASTIFTGLTVQRNDRGSLQAWTPTNYTAPLATTVVGPGELCLQAASGTGGPASVAACGDGTWWSLYPSGTGGASTPPALVVVPQRRQRPERRRRGVLDVRAADSGGWEVVVSPATGSPTQDWAIML